MYNKNDLLVTNPKVTYDHVMLKSSRMSETCSRPLDVYILSLGDLTFPENIVNKNRQNTATRDPTRPNWYHYIPWKNAKSTPHFMPLSLMHRDSPLPKYARAPNLLNLSHVLNPPCPFRSRENYYLYPSTKTHVD